MNFLVTYLAATWEMVAEMAPYLLLGFAIAGILHRYIKQDWIEKRLGTRSLKSIITASLVGVPMPLCSCGVVPVAASLRNHGASKGATASFLTSTPQTGIDSIAATYGMMGPLFALYRIIVAFLSGIFVGLVIEKSSSLSEAKIRRSLGEGGTSSSPSFENPELSRRAHSPTWSESFQYAFRNLPQDIGPHLIIGFLLAGLITVLTPESLLSNIPGGAITSILLTTLIATPLYICSTGSIPLALALIHSGFPISSALVLLIAGPATNAATIATMKKILGGKETTLYVASIVLISWISAFVFYLFFEGSVTTTTYAHHHEEGYTLLKLTSGIILTLLVLQKYLPKKSAPKKATSPDMKNITLQVNGMNCSHCQRSVEQGLSPLPGVDSIQVDLKAATVTITGPSFDQSEIVSKITDLGFEPQVD